MGGLICTQVTPASTHQEPCLLHPVPQPQPWEGELPSPWPRSPPTPALPCSALLLPAWALSCVPWLQLSLLRPSVQASSTWDMWQSSCARRASWRPYVPAVPTSQCGCPSRPSWPGRAPGGGSQGLTHLRDRTHAEGPLEGLGDPGFLQCGGGPTLPGALGLVSSPSSSSSFSLSFPVSPFTAPPPFSKTLLGA